MFLHYVKDALKEVVPQVLTAFIGWSVGVVLMGLYCALILFLYRHYGVWPMLVGSVSYMVLTYFFVDLWWTYREARRLHKGAIKK